MHELKLLAVQLHITSKISKTRQPVTLGPVVAQHWKYHYLPWVPRLAFGAVPRTM